MSLKATVMGPPCTYGSKRAFMVKGRPVLVNQNHKNLRTWQDAMRQAMSAAVYAEKILDFDSPPAVRICVDVYLARPKSHYGKRGLHSWALTTRPTKKPDMDKVLRAVADCGTGIWYGDDSQVVEMTARKWWADSSPERTEVTCEGCTDAPPGPAHTKAQPSAQNT